MQRIRSEVQVRAWRSLAKVHSLLVETMEEELWAERGLHGDWYDVLVTLRLAGGSLRMHELADQALISRSAATRLIDKIEEAGLVQRRVCHSDRRGMEVVLTTEGRKVQEGAAPVVLRGLRRHFGRHLDAVQAENLAVALESVLAGEGLTQVGLAVPAGL